MSAIAIRLDDVHLRLGRGQAAVDVLRGLSLTIAEGERVGIVGASGSGKSTALMVTTGLERADRGRIEVAGVDLGGLGEDALALFRGRTLGIVFQSFHLVSDMTAIENVATPLELAGVRDAFPRAAAELAAVGLAARLDHYPVQLSGGEQQRVAIARALVARPAIVVADEPTGNLDELTGADIADLLFARVAAVGATLMLVTHDPDLAARCDRVIHVKAGRVVGEGGA
ncbi:ATP-binding cassette domain-containing protein [Siculibacillus lacustris]|uniref:ATP-binding cassette domain-containing protein n=1 Tax=Siculibacillus lacustris TaxID=1549641 RepID=A0A4Q9VVU3_9HYPH|nr:ATP-binding cassette domain-containing protein [Siculibacillus lacustris]TBW39970.1 ATP-binding cassette domain-containing protein [Siculibacillus lacustris]